MKKPKLIAKLLLMVYATSCMPYGTLTQVNYTQLQKSPCAEKSNRIYLFFKGEQYDFNYEKIGLIEVNGRAYANEAEVLDYMKKKAWEQCADAIINIEIGETTRESGISFVEETEEVYRSKMYRGIAVNIYEDSTFFKKYYIPADTSFVERVNKKHEKISKSDAGWGIFLTLVGTVGVAVCVIAAINEEESNP